MNLANARKPDKYRTKLKKIPMIRTSKTGTRLSMAPTRTT